REREALHIAALDLAIHRTAIAVCVGNVLDPGHEREEASLLDRAARGEGEGPHRAPVKRAEERKKPRAAGVIARQLDSSFVGLRARVPEEDLDGSFEGNHGGDLLR